MPLAKALVAGGLRVLEITLRTAAAMDSMRAITGEVAGAIVGAGTVLGPAQLAERREAGAPSQSARVTPSLLDAAKGSGAAPARRCDRQRGHGSCWRTATAT